MQLLVANKLERDVEVFLLKISAPQPLPLPAPLYLSSPHSPPKCLVVLLLLLPQDIWRFGFFLSIAFPTLWTDSCNGAIFPSLPSFHCFTCALCRCQLLKWEYIFQSWWLIKNCLSANWNGYFHIILCHFRFLNLCTGSLNHLNVWH